MQIPNSQFGGLNGGKELFVNTMQPGMLIQKSSSTIILVQLVESGCIRRTYGFYFQCKS